MIDQQDVQIGEVTEDVLLEENEVDCLLCEFVAKYQAILNAIPVEDRALARIHIDVVEGLPRVDIGYTRKFRPEEQGERIRILRKLKAAGIPYHVDSTTPEI